MRQLMTFADTVKVISFCGAPVIRPFFNRIKQRLNGKDTTKDKKLIIFKKNEMLIKLYIVYIVIKRNERKNCEKKKKKKKKKINSQSID